MLSSEAQEAEARAVVVRAAVVCPERERVVWIALQVGLLEAQEPLGAKQNQGVMQSRNRQETEQAQHSRSEGAPRRPCAPTRAAARARGTW